MKKVLIIGICGAGKSTLSRKLSPILNLPIIHLDQEYWKPNWTPTEQEIWDKKVEELISREKWIMDGNYSSSFNQRFQAADTILYLNYPRRIALYRAIKRIVKGYGKVRPDSGEGCPERFDWEFIKYIWNFQSNQSHRAEDAIKSLGVAEKVIRFKHPKELNRFLKQNSLI